MIIRTSRYSPLSIPKCGSTLAVLLDCMKTLRLYRCEKDLVSFSGFFVLCYTSLVTSVKVR